MAEERKQNLEGVLRMALEHSDSQKPEADEPKEMSSENKKFLENALKSMTIDVIDEFKRAINVLENPASTTDSKVDAFCVIREHIDSIDFANDFVKVGGGEFILRFLKAGETRIRMNAIYVIAEMSQNNPFCQKHFLDANTLPLLVSYFKEGENIAGSALHAASALVRNYEPGLDEFLKLGGVDSLLYCLNTNYSRVFIKSCFLIGCLSAENQDVRDKFVKTPAVDILIKSLDTTTGFDIKIETILFALSDLSQSADWKINEDNRAKLRSVLTDIIEKNHHLAQCEEMVMYANVILKNLDNN